MTRIVAQRPDIAGLANEGDGLAAVQNLVDVHQSVAVGPYREPAASHTSPRVKLSVLSPKVGSVVEDFSYER